MICLQIRFLAGRFHGTGWYSAHNEGVPEWPPSPWRILRALVNAAYAEEIAVEHAEPLLEKLRGLPRYRLPLAVDAHTRHYMPDTDDANHKKAKVFDAFVAVDGGARDPQALAVAWEVDLSAGERELLARLCRRVSFLGRAESWAELSLAEDDGGWNCTPDEHGRAAGATNLLTLSSAADLGAWAAGQPTPKKGADVPRRLWDVLTFTSDRYRDEGWSSVPGTRLARYVFKSPPFRRAVVPSSGKAAMVRPTLARFAIRAAVLPRLHEALSICERLRRSAMSQSKTVSGEARPVFSGHGVGVSHHAHAMYLASSEDPRNEGFVDHLLVRAKDGFDAEEVLALQRLRRLWGRGGHDLELILVGLGQAADFGGSASPRTRLAATSRVWESVTPFVPTRHPKVVRGALTDSVEDQIRRACEHLLGIAPSTVEPFAGKGDWHRFRRRRPEGGGSRGPDRAFGARLVFDEPVSGPIALGYGAHVGLGVFAAAE